MDLVSSPQLLEQHEVIPPCEPHAGPNGQDHRAAVLPRQYDRAFASPRSLATGVDADGLHPPPVLLQVALALLPRGSLRHAAQSQRDPGQQPPGCPDTRHGHPSILCM